MNRRATGVLFCLIAALLFSARNITRAIIGGSMVNTDQVYGTALLVWSILSLIAGIIYIYIAEKKGE